MQWLLQPWPWWFSGILIGLMVPGLYILSGKGFGVSSSFRHLAAMCLPNSKVSYLESIIGIVASGIWCWLPV